MENHLDGMEVAKLKQVIAKIADFLVLFETAEEKLSLREKLLEDQFVKSQALLGEQLNEIQSALSDFATDVSAARWRSAIQKNLEAGEALLDEIKTATSYFVDHAQQTLDRLDKTSNQTVRALSQAVLTFNADDARKVVEDSCEEILKVSKSSIESVDHSLRWFQWKHMAIMLGIVVLTTIFAGFYVNGEWPWESHAKVVQERNLAEAVLAAWSQLSVNDQEQIAHHIHQHG